MTDPNQRNIISELKQKGVESFNVNNVITIISYKLMEIFSKMYS